MVKIKRKLFPSGARTTGVVGLLSGLIWLRQALVAKAFTRM